MARKESIKVKGMHCKSCEMLIEDELSELGVLEVKADNETGIVVVEYDESSLSHKDIIKAIRGEGYAVDESGE